MMVMIIASVCMLVIVAAFIWVRMLMVVFLRVTAERVFVGAAAMTVVVMMALRVGLLVRRLVARMVMIVLIVMMLAMLTLMIAVLEGGTSTGFQLAIDRVFLSRVREVGHLGVTVVKVSGAGI